ncbi:MAG: diaminopimelate epimerase [Alphaproteobacteria bacterium]
MNIINFHKMHGCGNDFVIIDNRKYKLNFSKEKLKFLADRNKAIGCDQIIIIEDFPQYDCFMRIYNNDGNEAGNCGNAARCVVSLLAQDSFESNLEKEIIFKIKTINSSLQAIYYDNKIISIDMGKPKFDWVDIPLTLACDTSNIVIESELPPGFVLNIGNPHIVYFVEDIDSINITHLGKKIENHNLFKEKINVNFVQIISNSEIILKTWERGAGLTLACGTGACAATVAAVITKNLQRKLRVNLRGGVLNIEFHKNNHIFMQGEAIYVFKGEILI